MWLRAQRVPERAALLGAGRRLPLRAVQWGGVLGLLLFDDDVGTERSKAAGEVLVAAPQRMAHVEK